MAAKANVLATLQMVSERLDDSLLFMSFACCFFGVTYFAFLLLLLATTRVSTGRVSMEEGLPYISRLQNLHLELPVFVGRSNDHDNHESKD